MAKRKKQTLLGDIYGLTGAGIGLGIGTAVAVKAAPSAVPALRTAAGFMPAITIGVMGRHALLGVSNISKASRKNIRRGKMHFEEDKAKRMLGPESYGFD